MYTMRELELWEAYDCFGGQVAEQVIQDPQWRKQYPEVFVQLDSQDRKNRNLTLIPLPMLRAMALAPNQAYAYFFRDNILRTYEAGAKIPDGYTEISASGAMEKFGTEALHDAADKGISGYPISREQYYSDDQWWKKPKQ